MKSNKSVLCQKWFIFRVGQDIVNVYTSRIYVSCAFTFDCCMKKRPEPRVFCHYQTPLVALDSKVHQIKTGFSMQLWCAVFCFIFSFSELTVSCWCTPFYGYLHLKLVALLQLFLREQLYFFYGVNRNCNHHKNWYRTHFGTVPILQSKESQS